MSKKDKEAISTYGSADKGYILGIRHRVLPEFEPCGNCMEGTTVDFQRCPCRDQYLWKIWLLKYFNTITSTKDEPLTAAIGKNLTAFLIVDSLEAFWMYLKSYLLKEAQRINRRFYYLVYDASYLPTLKFSEDEINSAGIDVLIPPEKLFIVFDAITANRLIPQLAGRVMRMRQKENKPTWFISTKPKDALIDRICTDEGEKLYFRREILGELVETTLKFSHGKIAAQEINTQAETLRVSGADKAKKAHSYITSDIARKTTSEL